MNVMQCLHLYLAGRCYKNPEVSGAPRPVNPARAITWLVGVTIYCTFFNNDSPPTPTRQLNYLKKENEKNRLGGVCSLNKFLDYKKAWTPWPYMHPYDWLFS